MDGEGGSAWAIKPGTAWAEEVEAEEAKHGPLVSEEAFPTLGEVSKKEGKGSKKGKGTKLSLSDFAAFPVGRSRQLSDKEILQQLPRGSSGLPKEDRDGKGLGGGFKDYGGNRQQGGFGDRERGGREEHEPSRADAAGDWGSERKFVPTDKGGGGSRGFGGGFKDREGGFGDSRGGGGGFGDRPPREERPISEADTVDDWGANRKFAPSAGDSGRAGSGGFGGGGFRDRERPAAGGPARFSDEPSRADQGDWGARRSTPDSERPGAGAPGARRGYGFSDQPQSQADMEDKWSHRGPPADAAGSSGDRAAPAERPKLKLAPRTLPLPEQQQQQQQANGAASSPRGSEADSTGSGTQQEQKPRKSNPFGAARPREEVLKEKGIDYQKEELKMEHGEVLRDTTPEEQEMESEVEGLRKQLDELQTATPDETDTISDLKKELDEKERALYTLQAKLDDELRYSKHRPEREREGSARSSKTAAEDMSGFEPVRNPRRGSATAAAGEAAPAGSGGSKEQEGAAAAPAAPAADGGGAWGRGGGGSFRDRERDGGRGGGGGFGGGSRDRDGPREGGGRDGGRGAPPPREGRSNESPAGRAGGGW